MALLFLAGNTIAFAQRSREHDRSSGQQHASNDRGRQEARPAAPQRHEGPIRSPRSEERRFTPQRTEPNSPQRSYGNQRPNDFRNGSSGNRQSAPQVQTNDIRNRYTINSPRSYNSNNRYGNYRPVYTNRPGGNYGYRPGYNISYRPRYTRPPMIWQGRRYYSFYNYTYHPYRPFYYGSYFHPIGFFTAALNFAAISIFWDNQYYHYYDGVYYQPYNNGYRVVPPPYGASIRYLPSGYSTIALGDDTFYYYAGVFYINDGTGYIITQAPPGAVVYDLPEGCTEVVVGNVTYLQYNDVLYQPIVLDGRNAYEVVEPEDEN